MREGYFEEALEVYLDAPVASGAEAAAGPQPVCVGALEDPDDVLGEVEVRVLAGEPRCTASSGRPRSRRSLS